MARQLGLAGIANTNGARSFAGKEEAEVVSALVSTFSIALNIGISIALLLCR